MDFKKLEKAKKYYEEILALDNQILSAEKIMNYMVNNKFKAKINIDVFDPDKEIDKPKKSDTSSYLFSSIFSFDQSIDIKKECEIDLFHEKIEFNTHPKMMIHILGVSLEHLNQKRNHFISQIEKLQLLK